MHGRFATGDLDSLLRAKGRDQTRHHASENTSLAQGTNGWNQLGANTTGNATTTGSGNTTGSFDAAEVLG